MKFFKQVKHQSFPFMYSIPGQQPLKTWIDKPFLGSIYRSFLKTIAFQRIIFADMTEYFNHYSATTDYVIIGENPILTALLLKKINEKSILTKQQYNVLIVNFSDDDYWAYHTLEKNDYFKSLNINGVTDIDSYWKYCLSDNISSNLNLSFTNSTEQINHVKYNANINKWLIFFENKNNQDKNNYFHQLAPTVTQVENKLKNNYWAKFFIFISEHKIKFNIVKPEQKEKSFYLLSDNVFLSSYPLGWMNVETTVIDTDSNFNHELADKSFGSAIKVSTAFTDFEDQSENDIKTINQLKI